MKLIVFIVFKKKKSENRYLLVRTNISINKRFKRYVFCRRKREREESVFRSKPKFIRMNDFTNLGLCLYFHVIDI